MATKGFGAFFALTLIFNAFCVPLDRYKKRDVIDNEIGTNVNAPFVGRGDTDEAEPSEEPNGAGISPDVLANVFDNPASAAPSTNIAEKAPVNIPLPEDDDDDDFEHMEQSPTVGGSNIISLINLATGLFPGSNANNIWIRNMIKYLMTNNLGYLNPLTIGLLNRMDVMENEIELDYPKIKPMLNQRADSDETSDSEEDSSSEESERESEKSSEEHKSSSGKDSSSPEESNESEVGSEESDNNGNKSENKSSSKESNSGNKSSASSKGSDSSDKSSSEDNNAAEESVEVKVSDEKNSKQTESDEGSQNGSSDSDYDSDEPPGGGDGQGGGILGLLAGLSGGEDGSDLGSLLAAVGGIVANLSGDGFDLNSLIASGLGLFVGLLSEGDENPGAVVASYLLTSLDSITGGGSQNNGAFFGNFLSKLLKGTSAMLDEEGEVNVEGGSDSAGFIGSLLMGLFGSMSKGSS